MALSDQDRAWWEERQRRRQLEAAATPQPEQREKTGFLRSAADSGLALGSGVVQGVQMITNLAGADNAASRALGSVSDAIRGMESDPRKAERAARTEKIKAAEESGSTWEEIKAYAGAFGDAPIDTTLEALGTSLPSIGAAMLTGGGSAAAQASGQLAARAAPHIASRLAPAAIGAVQGVGAVKGGIYDAVQQQWLEAGASPEEAQQRAAQAQSYSGGQAGHIAAGGVLGALAGGTGVEAGVRRMLAPAVAREAAESVAAPGVAKAAAVGVAKETPMEALQGGQERVASNMALQDEGFDTPTFQGVAGQMALEGLASAPMGGGFGALEAAAARPGALAEDTAPSAPDPLRLGSNPDPLITFPDGTMGRRSEVDAYINGLPEDQQTAERARLLGLGAQPAEPALADQPPTPSQLPYDPETGRREELDNYIASLPEDQQVPTRAKLLGLGAQPAEPVAVARVAELETIAADRNLTPDEQAERADLLARIQADDTAGSPADQIQQGAATQPTPDHDHFRDATKMVSSEPFILHEPLTKSQRANFHEFAKSRGVNSLKLKKTDPQWQQLHDAWAAAKTAERTSVLPDAPVQAQQEVPPAQGDLQNRDRGRAASVLQMSQIAQNPDYLRLGISRTPDSGAPMVFANADDHAAVRATGREDVAVMSDGQRVPFRYAVIEAEKLQPSHLADGSRNPEFANDAPGIIKALNNGRSAGIKAAYQIGRAGEYRAGLMADAAAHGVPPQAIEQMQDPVLVRVYSQQHNAGNMAARSQAQGLGLSLSEMAAQDAQMIDSSVLGVYEPGDVSSAANRDFARAFVGKLHMDGQDVAGMIDGSGQLSQDGARRLNAAMVQAAYSDNAFVDTMFSSTDNDVRSIGEALRMVAGEWANMRDSARKGVINPQADITPNLMHAVRMVEQSRRERKSLYDMVNQVDIETGTTVDPVTVGVLRMLYHGDYFSLARGRAKVVDSLRDYLAAASTTTSDGGMFGDMISPEQIFEAIQTQGETNAQAQPAAQSGGQPAGGNASGSDPVQAGAQGERQAGEAAGQEPAGRRKTEPRQDAEPAAGQQTGKGGQRNGSSATKTQLSRPADALELTSPTRQQVIAQQEAAEAAATNQAKADAQAERQEREKAERKEVARRSEAAADTFELGQDAMENLTGQKSMFASEPTANYDDSYEKDLFGEPLQAKPRKAAAKTGGARMERDVQPSGAVPGDTPAPAGEYNVRTIVGSEIQRKLSVRKISSFADLAKATRYLYRSAVERFDGIVTDRDGKPLAVVGGFKGALSSASVPIPTIIAESVRVPGAAHIWFSHNHPSGKTNLSRADEALNNELTQAFSGSGIEPMGLIAVGGDRYSASNGEDGVIGPIQHAPVSVPVIEREQIRDDVDRDTLSSPAAAMSIAEKFHKQAGGAPGMILLDSQLSVTGWVPLTDAMMGNLRSTGQLRAIYRAISEGNAATAILVHGGELDALHPASQKVTIGENIAAAATKAGTRVVDSINARTKQSAALLGRNIESGPVYSRTNKTEKVDGPAGAETAGHHDARTSGVGVDVLAQIVDSVRARMPNAPSIVPLKSASDAPAALRKAIEQAGAQDDVEGAWYGGKIYMFADNLSDAARAEHVLAEHEIAHAGLAAILGDKRKPVMRDIWLHNSSVRKKAGELQKVLGIDEITATEEALVDIPTSELVKLDGWRNLVSKVRDWLDANGFERLATRLNALLDGTLSDQERANLYVADLVRMARQWAEGKRQKGYAGTTKLYEKESSGEWVLSPAFSQAADLSGRIAAAAKQAVVRWQDSLRNASKNPQAPDPYMPTPGVLRVMGAKAAKLVLPRTYLKAILNKHPDVPAHVFENLPAMLADPLFIIPHKSGGLRVFVDATTSKGEPIVAGVSVDAGGRIQTVTPFNDAADAGEGMRRRNHQIKQALQNGERIYARNREALEQVRASDGEAPGLIPLHRESRANTVAAPATIALHRDSISAPSVVTREKIVKAIEARRGGALFQRAYHGTPHQGIEKTGFQLNKIGTGEGAQAYGWGMYFAGRREVAESYRTALTQPINDAGFERLAEDIKKRAPEAYEAIRAATKGGSDLLIGKVAAAVNAGRNPSVLDVNQIAAIRAAYPAGQLYQAEIPEDSDLLDWDKPLSEQPQKVQQAFSEGAKTERNRHLARLWERAAGAKADNFWQDAAEFYRALVGLYASDAAPNVSVDTAETSAQEQASRVLQSIGIPGLRYLDGNSRSGGEGTHNYVIWDEALLTPENAAIEAMYSRSAKPAQSSSMGPMTAEQERAYKKVFGVQKVPTLKERAEAMRQNLGVKLKQALVDQFAPIKDVSEQAYMLARMTKGSDGTLEAALLYGKPFLRDGVPDVDVKDGGFANVLADLKGEHDRFMAWVSAQRAERLKTQGKENLFSDQDISALKTLNTGRMADGRARMDVYGKAMHRLNAFNESVLKMAQESGLIDEAAFDLMKDQPYVPFYRIMDEEGGMRGPSFSSGLTNQKAWQKLKGGSQQLNADLLQNLLMNWAHLYAASSRNRAALATMDAAAGMAVAYRTTSDAKGAAKVMRNGQSEYWAVEDPFLLNAISALHYTPSPLMKPLTTMKQLLTWGVTVNPTFKARNLIRDVVSSMATSDLGYNPLQNVKQGWKLSAKDSQVYASMLASGGVIKFGTQENTDRVRAQVNKLGGVMLDQSGWQKLTGQLQTLYDAYNEFGDKTENVSRVALYDQLRKKGVSHAEASFMARDLMDFSMGGNLPLVRFLTQTVPFLNARMQGLYKLGRAASNDPRKFTTVTAAVAMASLALLAAYADDEDWKKREDWDRDSYWWFKVGDTAFRIPKPFEVGAIGTLAERTAELMFSKEMTNKRFMERLSHMLAQTFALDPVPQAFKPLLDVYANKDSFTGRSIESMADQRLRPQDRYNEKTSEVARLLGSWGLPDPAQLIKGDYAGLSPKQVDHLLRGYFSWVGTASTTVSDYAVRPLRGLVAQAGGSPVKGVLLLGWYGQHDGK